MGMDRRGFGTALAGALLAPGHAATASAAEGGGLTSVAGVKVGHFTDSRRPTGCTVVLVEDGAVCGVDVRGGAPGTRETDLLRPENTVERVHAVVLAGGSAFGLDAASGVVAFLEERRVGFALGPARVPIVPAAVLFDLALGDWTIRPDAATGYAAAKAAASAAVAEGNVGAGAGATVGKLRGLERAMKAGLGTASITLPGGPVVAALVAVNAFGDVVDPASGRVVAGFRREDGRGIEGTLEALMGGAVSLGRGENTVIGVVATTAGLAKAQAQKVAQMAHDGLARCIRPSHTPWDGDTLFALSTGDLHADTLLVGAAAAEVVARAVLRAAQTARGLPGLPAASDLART
jgi:L-aminopeptidase/D-esterase-like protein